MTEQQKIDKAQKIFKQLEAIGKGRDLLGWKEMELWYFLKTDSLFKYVWGEEKYADNEKSWKKFVAEVGTPLNTVEFKIRIYKTWIIDLGFRPEELKDIHTRKLDRAIPAVKGGKNVQEIIEQAKALSFSDFLIWLNGNQEPCRHYHREKITKEVKKCSDCGKELH